MLRVLVVEIILRITMVSVLEMEVLEWLILHRILMAFLEEEMLFIVVQMKPLYKEIVFFK